MAREGTVLLGASIVGVGVAGSYNYLNGWADWGLSKVLPKSYEGSTTKSILSHVITVIPCAVVVGFSVFYLKDKLPSAGLGGPQGGPDLSGRKVGETGEVFANGLAQNIADLGKALREFVKDNSNSAEQVNKALGQMLQGDTVVKAAGEAAAGVAIIFPEWH